MMRDLHESLEDIHVGSVSMKERIWEIQSNIIPRSSAQKWAQNLRFITCGDKPASEPIRLDSLVVESGVSYDEDYDDDDDDDFNNVNSDESSSDDANIRICDCPKSDNPPGKPLDECFAVHTRTGAGSRTNRAPTNVLERAMSFAEHHNYKLIWIDQECIEQRDDSQDKKFGIQSTDWVFQNASASVALLSGYIDEQRQLDAFFDLVEIDQPDMSRDVFINPLEVLEIIS